MENINENIGLIVSVVVVFVVIALQVISFLKTRAKVKELGDLFTNVEDLFLKETSITPNVLRSKTTLQKFLENIPARYVKNEDDEENGYIDYINLSLIAISDSKKANNRMRIIIDRTNEYLCKNTGTSADLGILENIFDNQKNALEDEIHNSLNVPLYLGLAGTFVGIITGLIGVNFKEIFDSSTTELTGLQHLLYGVVVAMSASFLGLGFTVFNSAVSYKEAVTKSNEGKGEYMDFLRRELMPLLSNSMASSLNSLRGVLGNFVDKFGKNLNAYADSAELLNDNLEKQHLVLVELNNLSLTKTANKISETFMTLKEASESLNVFHSYQQQLNSTIVNITGMVNQIQALLDKFDEFSVGLSLLVKSQNNTNELQRMFQEAITTHFPTGSDAREVWRKEFDLFMSEGKQVSESLSAQLMMSTEHIKNFVDNNNEFFDTFDKMKEVMSTMVQYTQVQAECYRDLKSEISNLRVDYKDAQIETIELHKATLKAVDMMTKALKDINKK